VTSLAALADGLLALSRPRERAPQPAWEREWAATYGLIDRCLLPTIQFPKNGRPIVSVHSAPHPTRPGDPASRRRSRFGEPTTRRETFPSRSPRLAYL